MATSTASPGAPDATALQKKREPLQARRATLARRLDEIFHLTSPNRLVDGPAAGTEADRLRARAEEPQVRYELTLLDAQLSEIDAEIRTAQDAERRQRQAEARQRLRPVIAELAQALNTAAAINRRVPALEAEAGLGQLSAPWLADESALTGSWLASWRRMCVEHGLLD